MRRQFLLNPDGSAPEGIDLDLLRGEGIALVLPTPLPRHWPYNSNTLKPSGNRGLTSRSRNARHCASLMPCPGSSARPVPKYNSVRTQLWVRSGCAASP